VCGGGVDYVLQCVCVCLCEMYVCVMCVCVCFMCVGARAQFSELYVCNLGARTTMYVSSTKKIGPSYARGTCAVSLSVY
jgi:hypothetical protein